MATRSLATDKWDLIRVDERTHQTNIPNVFAGGHVVNGADLAGPGNGRLRVVPNEGWRLRIGS